MRSSFLVKAKREANFTTVFFLLHHRFSATPGVLAKVFFCFYIFLFMVFQKTPKKPRQTRISKPPPGRIRETFFFIQEMNTEPSHATKLVESHKQKALKIYAAGPHALELRLWFPRLKTGLLISNRTSHPHHFLPLN